jgi:uncharacterized protein (DUF4213/DUF364 family)
MDLLNKLLTTLPDGRVVQVSIGLHWTAVLTEVENQLRCGLATTIHAEHCHGVLDVPQAGKLENQSALELAARINEAHSTMASVGMAAINALLPQRPETWEDLNAEEVIAVRGSGKSVVLIGHFPFVDRLRERVGKLTILELNPRPGDLPVTKAKDIIPSADVVAITAMTLINHTLDDLLELCDPQACVILLGPSTPLSPVLFNYNVDLLCGSIVTDIDSVLHAVRQGANFRQVHRAGVRLVSISNPGG